MTQPNPQPDTFLALAWKLLQVWTKSPQNWKLKVFLSIATILSALYGIGSIPSPNSTAESAKPSPTPPAVHQEGHCNQNINGSGNTAQNSPNCSTSSQVFPGGLSVSSVHTGGVTAMSVYQLGLAASGRASLSTAASLIAPGNGGTTLKVNPIASPPAGNVLLPIAIGAYRTGKITGQIGGNFYTGAISVGGTIVAGTKRVKRWVTQIGQPDRPELSNAERRSCSSRSQ